MPNIILAFDGTDITQDTSHISAIAGLGTVASDTAQSYTGPRSLKSTSGNPTGFSEYNFYNVLADSGRRISVRQFFEVMPPSPGTNFFDLNNTSDLQVFSLFSDTGGHIAFRNGDGTVVKTGTTVLSASTWYRFGISWVIITTTNWSAKIYINGSLEVSVTNADATLIRTGINRFRQRVGGQWGVGKSIWTDDLYIDDGTDLADPGDVRVILYKKQALLGVGWYPGYYALP